MMVVSRQQVVHGAYKDSMIPHRRKWRNKKSNQMFRKRNKMMQQVEKGNMRTGVYDPPRLKDLEHQNRLKTRKHFPKRKRCVPRAPFNNSSFLMRVRRSGGLASPVSPVTPAFLTASVFSPAPHYREALAEEVKDLCVNGYGSMAGLIRLRAFDDKTFNSGNLASDSNRLADAQSPCSGAQSVQQLEQRLEQRLDRDVCRFEIAYPSKYDTNSNSQLMEIYLAEQESHIAHREDENLTLKERLFLVQQELIELGQRVQGGVSNVVDEHEDACSDYGSSDRV